MRKTFIALLVIILTFTTLTACTNYTFENEEIEATVVSCEKGNFVLASEYVAIANMYLGKNKPSMYTMYMNLARSNGTYNYNISICIEGENYVVVRSEPYEVGQTIQVNVQYSYANGELVNVEYS